MISSSRVVTTKVTTHILCNSNEGLGSGNKFKKPTWIMQRISVMDQTIWVAAQYLCKNFINSMHMYRNKINAHARTRIHPCYSFQNINCLLFLIICFLVFLLSLVFSRKFNLSLVEIFSIFLLFCFPLQN